MTTRDQYLRPMLDGGSSRVFNCCDRFQRLQEEGDAECAFFRYQPFHKMVIIKEANLDPRMASLGRNLVTKLYFPYNGQDIYEGGRSVYLHDPQLLTVLNELIGLQGRKLVKDDVRSDLKLLHALDGLPSLDAFLMRDKLELDGFAPNPLFLEVPEHERAAIYDYIRQKFEPLVRAALPGASWSKVAQLVDKIWEAKDLDALEPLIEACHFPKRDALSIFSSWKGINFYSFSYEHLKPRAESLRTWLNSATAPRYTNVSVDLGHLAFLKREAQTRLEHHWTILDEIARQYDAVYQNFLARPEATGAFIKFLRRSSEIYWRMGASLSAVNHAAHCWDLSTVNFLDRRLPVEGLMHVLDCLARVLAEEQRRPEPDTSAHFAFA